MTEQEIARYGLLAFQTRDGETLYAKYYPGGNGVSGGWLVLSSADGVSCQLEAVS